MSFKTDRLVALFPDAYAAREGASVLRRLLDAVGFEFMRADESVKGLLKSHWINYAQGDALDGLAAAFGVERRRLSDGNLEPDPAFRRRLKALVPYFTGGGTVKAVAGAVRSALGLPFDLELFRRELVGPEGGDGVRFDALIRALDGLVKVLEFSPKGETVLSEPVTKTDVRSEVIVEAGFSSVKQVHPRIEWTFTHGGGRLLTLQRLDSGQGVKSKPGLRVNPGDTLVFTAVAGGLLNVSLGNTDLTSFFTNWDDSEPPLLPELPAAGAQWQFTAKSGIFDLSVFDDTEGMDLPDFSVRIAWTRFQPLTFDVIVPYFLKAAVDAVKESTGFRGDLLIFEGLPLAIIQEVVNQTRAAGVKGMVHFSLNFSEDHAVREQLQGLADHRNTEDQGMLESVTVGSLGTAGEDHAVGEHFALGGVFDVAVFDGSFGFQ